MRLRDLAVFPASSQPQEAKLHQHQQEHINATDIADMCTCTSAADPSRTTERESINDLRSGQKAAESQRRFHPVKLLCRLGKAESELGLRLSSLGIQRHVAAGNPESLQRPSHSTGTSTPMSQVVRRYFAIVFNQTKSARSGRSPPAAARRTGLPC
jgi:hypothetical protein